MGSCGGGAAKRTLNKAELRQRADVTTPKYGFSVVLDEGMNFKLKFIDQHWDSFSKCYENALGTAPRLERAKEFKLIVTKRKWKCVYHGKGCTAEIDIGRKEIYLTRLNLQMDKHEWAHLYDLLDGDDNRTTKGKKARCFPMKSNK